MSAPKAAAKAAAKADPKAEPRAQAEPKAQVQREGIQTRHAWRVHLQAAPLNDECAEDQAGCLILGMGRLAVSLWGWDAEAFFNTLRQWDWAGWLSSMGMRCEGFFLSRSTNGNEQAGCLVLGWDAEAFFNTLRQWEWGGLAV